MDAMTMPFNVAEPKMLAELRPGDEIEAKLVVGEKSSRLEGIVVSRHGTAPAVQTIPEQGPYGRPGDAAPETVLVGSDGKPLSLADYRGKAVALTFIFTRCPLPEFCPRMNAQFAEMEAALAKDAALYGKTQLLSVSFDPEHDTPAVLKEYRERFLKGVKGVDPEALDVRDGDARAGSRSSRRSSGSRTSSRATSSSTASRRPSSPRTGRSSRSAGETTGSRRRSSATSEGGGERPPRAKPRRSRHERPDARARRRPAAFRKRRRPVRDASRHARTGAARRPATSRS